MNITLHHQKKLVSLAFGFIAFIISIASSARALQYTGLNLAGADFGVVGGAYGSSYLYPNQTEVDYFLSKGMNIARLPFLWERLQPSLNAALDSAESNRLDTFVSTTTSKGMYVMLDPHNYARYNGNLIGSASVPVTAFSNFWWRVANIYRTNNHVIFGLMNEPHDMTTEA